MQQDPKPFSYTSFPTSDFSNFQFSQTPFTPPVFAPPGHHFSNINLSTGNFSHAGVSTTSPFSPPRITKPPIEETKGTKRSIKESSIKATTSSSLKVAKHHDENVKVAPPIEKAKLILPTSKKDPPNRDSDSSGTPENEWHEEEDNDFKLNQRPKHLEKGPRINIVLENL